MFRGGEGQQVDRRARGRGKARKSGGGRLREPPEVSQSSHVGYMSSWNTIGRGLGRLGEEDPHGDPSKSKRHLASLQEGEK